MEMNRFCKNLDFPDKLQNKNLIIYKYQLINSGHFE